MKPIQKIWMLSLLGIAFVGLSSAATVPFIDTKSVSTWPVNAWSSSSEEATSAVTTDSKMIAPYYGESKTYTFDQAAAKTLLNKKSSLIKVNCNSAQVLKDLGLGQNTKITSISVGEEIFDYSFDFRNCSMRGNKRNTVWSNKPIKEAAALAIAKEFMSNKYFGKKVFNQYGTPIVIYRNGNNIRPYILKEAASTTAVADDDISLSGVDIDPTDTGDINVEPEYISFSILFPYSINGTPIYNAYGNRAGVTVEVTADGVTNVNAQLLPFKGAARNAEKLSGDDMVKFVQKGGNNSYRGSEKEVVFKKPQRVLVLFNLWRNNTNELYMSSGIRFASDIKQDQWSAQNYEMIISDYKIGNNNFGW